VKALTAAGFTILQQHGSHVILRRQDPSTQVVVPDHAELDRGTLRAIIRQTGMTRINLKVFSKTTASTNTIPFLQNISYNR
jgi:predicted RNA binding protein YcfA (HicA-like mRNA interferase family)